MMERIDMNYEEQNEKLREYWDRGWNDYWNGVKQNNCPTYEEQEKRDEWMLGWLTAQSAALYEGSQDKVV
jgi:ribosome modulation factor